MDSDTPAPSPWLDLQQIDASSRERTNSAHGDHEVVS